MKMVRKTYAAPGLLEFKMALKIGGALIRIIFSGGYMGTNGVVAAKYTTDNPAIIKLIENSEQFKSRRISLYQEVELPDVEKPKEETTPETPTERDNGEVIFDDEDS